MIDDLAASHRLADVGARHHVLPTQAADLAVWLSHTPVPAGVLPVIAAVPQVGGHDKLRMVREYLSGSNPLSEVSITCRGIASSVGLSVLPGWAASVNPPAEELAIEEVSVAIGVRRCPSKGGYS